MESLNTLFKIFLYIYLGLFTYLTYHLFFYFQKRMIIIKTFSFFFGISVLIIKISNKYDITFFIGYLFFYCLGIYIAKMIFKRNFNKNTKLVKHFLILPFKKQLIVFIKKITFYDLLIELKNKVKLYFYYRKYPYKKPKTIYELF